MNTSPPRHRSTFLLSSRSFVQGGVDQSYGGGGARYHNSDGFKDICTGNSSRQDHDTVPYHLSGCLIARQGEMVQSYRLYRGDPERCCFAQQPLHACATDTLSALNGSRNQADFASKLRTFTLDVLGVCGQVKRGCPEPSALGRGRWTSRTGEGAHDTPTTWFTPNPKPYSEDTNTVAVRTYGTPRPRTSNGPRIGISELAGVPRS